MPHLLKMYAVNTHLVDFFQVISAAYKLAVYVYILIIYIYIDIFNVIHTVPYI